MTQFLWPRDFCLPTFPWILCKLPAHEAALNVQVTCKQPRQGGGRNLCLWIWAEAAASQHKVCAAACIWQRCRAPSCQQLYSAGQAFPRTGSAFGTCFPGGSADSLMQALLKCIGMNRLQAGRAVVLYARQDLLPVHIPALFVVLKLLGCWFQPTSLGPVGCRNHSSRCCECHMASQGTESM